MNWPLYLLSTNCDPSWGVMIVVVRIDWQHHCGQFEH
jgi:hypothetical protein